MIKILYTTDIHGHITQTDYLDRKEKKQGIFSLLLDEPKDKNTLIIDGGDILQGSPFSDKLQKRGDPYYIAEAFNLCKYDYITLGNHDFNYGKKYLEKFINTLDAKCLCLNVKGLDILDYDIVEIDNLKVMIVGITTDYINVWEKKENLEGFIVQDTFEALKDFFKKDYSYDILIGLYHGGVDYDLKTSENIAVDICKNFDFDILLTAHQHMDINDLVIDNTHVFQISANAKKLLEINIEKKDTLVVKSEFKEGKLKKIPNKYIELDLLIQNHLDEKITSLKEDIHPKTPLKRALEGSTFADLINIVQLNYSKSDISVTSLANSISGFKKELTVRDILNTYLYENTFLVKEIGYNDLLSVIEHTLSYFKDSTTISDSFLIPKIEHYNYDYYYGIDIYCDLTKPVGSRVLKIKKDNRTLKENDVFKICINNYRASGAGGYDIYKELKTLKEYQVSTKELIIDYLKNNTIPKEKKAFIRID